MSDQEVAIAKALDAIMIHEGGWADNPKDPGGPTMRGVTLKTLQALQPGATLEDLRALTDQQARDIYRRNYFDLPRISELPALLIPVVADMSVNAGFKRAIIILQQILGTVADGTIGPATLTTAQSSVDHRPQAAVNAYVDARIGFYNHLVAADPTKAEFLHGWVSRANSYRLTEPT